MAITKIISINETDTGNPTKHLKQAMEYIINPDKTSNHLLVGGINCLPETAFEQMLETKQMFDKINKRQGYHIIISFVPGEATEEVAYDIVERFAREYLEDEYEAVYAVHNDKNHMHAHLIFNSVNMVNGKKYEYRKGEWKRSIQPITNKLCKEYNLEIMPAEYAKNPKNLVRTEWEQEKQFEKMILSDAVFCQSHAGSLEHFIFLMKRIGYQFEKGKYLSIKVPGGKWYHQLEKLDERFGERLFENYLGIGYSSAKFISTNPTYFYRSGLSNFQLQYYHKMYQIRMVEQKRFNKQAAVLAKELQRFHQLQKEYLFLVDNDIRSWEDVIRYQLGKLDRMNEISTRQKEIYKESGIRKRACYTEEDTRDFQIWHGNVQNELDMLKAEKKEIKEKIRIARGCLGEFENESMLDLVSVEEEIKTKVEVPEYVEGDARKVEEVKTMVEDEVDVTELDVGDETGCEEVSEIETSKNMVEEDVSDDIVSEEEFVTVAEEDNRPIKVNYEVFKDMTPVEKANMLGLEGWYSFQDVYNQVKLYLKDSEYDFDFDEIMDEAQLVYRGMKNNYVKQRAVRIAKEINSMGFKYQYLTNREKANLFQFTIDDNKFNLELHMAVLKECGVNMDFDEVYEDYQKIYDWTMEFEKEKKIERGERGRW